jgi:hypothetical protein
LAAGKATITPATGLALEKALDIPASFWLARDARYQESLAREASRNEMAANVSWLDELPLKDMCKFKWIKIVHPKRCGEILVRSREGAIREFAEQIEIAPGIVLGRLQKEYRFPWKFVEETLLPQGFQVRGNERIYNDEGVQIAELDIEVRGRVA